MSTPASAPTHSQAVGLIGLGLMGRTAAGVLTAGYLFTALSGSYSSVGTAAALIPGSSVSRANPCRYPYV